jgi:hypothetical protein
MADLEHNETSLAGIGSESGHARLSRRGVMTASAVAGAAGLASVPALAEAKVTGQAVSLGLPGTTTVEFRGRVLQSGSAGDSFTSFGYLIRASHAKKAGLFSGTPISESTALLTAYATGVLQARTVDMAVHALDIVGTMTVYQRKTPGASFANPPSFKVGTPVAVYHMTLQDILTVFATDTGLPTLTGDMRQTAAHSLSGPLAGQTFGKLGTRLRFFATGLGQRTSPTPSAQLEIAGNWAIE